MKLNKIFFRIFAIAGLVSFTACDNIAEDDRYIPVNKPVIPIEEVSQVLLIQEFTGVRCTNCPEGAQKLHDIQEEYPDNVIIVGMHPFSGGFTTPILPTIDFRTQAAEAMYKIFRPDGFPTAFFNGKESSTVLDQWLSIATGMIGKIANMSIATNCSYNNESRELEVKYSIDFIHDITSDNGFGVMVWIMENNITGPQLADPNKYGASLIPEYVHNHVLRASLNGDDGEKIGTSFKARDTYSGTASMTLDDSWNAENCQVVVYVFNQSTHEVEQASLSNI